MEGSSSAKRRRRDDLSPTTAETEAVGMHQSCLMTNRNHAMAYRTRRQNHLEQLEIKIGNLKAEIGQMNEMIDIKEAENSMIRSENAALRQQCGMEALHSRLREEETERLRAEIERFRRMVEAVRQETENTMTSDLLFLQLEEANKNTYFTAFLPFFPNHNMSPSNSPADQLI